MKNIIRMSIFLTMLFVMTSCVKSSYKAISIQKFEIALKEKNIDRIVYSGEKTVLVVFKDSEELIEIKNDSVLPKHWIKQIKGIVDNYDVDGIIFETKTNFF